MSFTGRTRKVVCEVCKNEFETKHWRKKQCDGCKESENYAQNKQEREHMSGKRKKKPEKKTLISTMIGL